MEALLVAIQWFNLGTKVIAAGSTAWAQIKAVLSSHGIESDTSALDSIIADADRRKALAEREAQS